MQFFDTIALGQAVEITGTRLTRNGSLVVNARAARGGNVQDYLGSEVGKPEMPIVRVYRDADEIFNRDRLQTFAHKPVTLNHPSGPVTSKTWRDVTRGHTGDEVLRDGEFIRIPMMVADQTAIDAIKGGHRELSAGYECDLDFTPGVSPSGAVYDAKQVRVLIDHIAIVPKGRAGPDCKIGDEAIPDAPRTMRALSDEERRDLVDYDQRNPIHQDRKVSMKTLTIDGHAVELSDAALIAVSNLQKQNGTLTADNLKMTADLKAANEAHAKALGDKDGEILKLQADHKVALDAKDAEIAKLKGEVVTADKLDAAVAERSAVVEAAKPILGDSFDAKGKTVADIRRATVAKRLGDKAVEGKTDEHVTVAFDTLTAAGVIADPLRNAITASVSTQTNDRNPVDPHAARNARLRDAWKGEPAAGNA